MVNDKAPTNDVIEEVRRQWISKDKVRKLLGFFATARPQQDWNVAETDQYLSQNSTWEDFLEKMRLYYKPTEHYIIRNYEFRQLTQLPNETFSAFCNRIEAAGKTCHFCECTRNCKAEEYAVRDQIVIGTTNDAVRQKVTIKNRSLSDLRKNG